MIVHKKKNIPQFFIQITALLLTVNDSTNGAEESSSFLITILSMLFTIISVLLSVFEYILARGRTKSETIRMIGVRFTVMSDELAAMGYLKFQSRIVFHKRIFLYNIAKLFHLNRHQIERLIPKRISSGVQFLLIIETDSANLKHTTDSIKSNIVRGILAKQVASTYELNEAESEILADDKDFEIVCLGNNYTDQEKSDIKQGLNAMVLNNMSSSPKTLSSLGSPRSRARTAPVAVQMSENTSDSDEIDDNNSNIKIVM